MLADLLQRGEQCVDHLAGLAGIGGQSKRFGDGGEDGVPRLDDAGSLHPVAAGAQGRRRGNRRPLLDGN
ncbi:hypothetical protein [Nonomuraea zeae]|uniref:hypothetical protein n=1 Tax=Nonomuraea zeae TaxID=1642303 RepID=UPI001478987D|nr:hypothetical protein [Nonomuraea zeae]